MLTSLLTLYAVGKAWNLAFWRTPEQAHEMAETLAGGSSAAADEGTQDEGARDLHERMAAGEVPARLPRSMTAAAGALVAFSLALTVAAGPLYAYTARAAEDLTDRATYVDAVLAKGVRDDDADVRR